MNDRNMDRNSDPANLLKNLGMCKTIPELLADSVRNNDSLAVRIEQPSGCITIGHKPKTSNSRRELIIKVESDD
jgi:hypothetical protein